MTSDAPAQRHPATEHLLSLFSFSHLPPVLAEVSAFSANLAHAMANTLDDGPELTAGLRKLLEAKDAFVRQAVIDLRAHGAEPVDR